MPKEISTRRALVFEDNDSVRELMKTILINKGYQVRVFESPLAQGSCYHQCFEHTFRGCDLVVTDYSMPGLDGLSFIKEKLIHCSVKHIAIISGYLSASLEQEAIALGCMVFKKPFSLTSFYNWLDGLDATHEGNGLSLSL